MVPTTYGQTFLDTDTGEMIVIDSLESGDDILQSKQKKINHIYYANHTATFVPMKVKEIIHNQYIKLPYGIQDTTELKDYPIYLRIKAVFPNDESKVYQFDLVSACGMSLSCLNPDKTKQSFLLINQNKKTQGNAIEHIRKEWSGDFCYVDPNHPNEKISIDLNTRPFKATYYGGAKAKPIPLLMSDINTKDFTFTLAFPAKPKEIYRCKITSVHFYANFELTNPDGRKQKFEKIDCNGWGK
jgi:hypothetical protein